MSKPAQYTIYKRTPAKNSVQEPRAGCNEDLLDAQIDIVNHNQAYQSRLETQKSIAGWQTTQQSLELSSGLIKTQTAALSRTATKEQDHGRESRQAYTQKECGGEITRIASLDYKEVSASVAQDASGGEALANISGCHVNKTNPISNAPMMDPPRGGPDASARRKKKFLGKDRYSHQASERHHREQTHTAIQVPLSQFIMPDKLNHPGEHTLAKRPRQLTCNGFLRQQHRPSTSANKLVSTAKHRADLEQSRLTEGPHDELHACQ